ncbi:hypothetical protein Egran_03724 [Elaphomyces granulatus]|uniref:Uncharacterized protein n=1 Tax=Elaphomyces granulatus TaxID=519963 RepID=A0A232LWI7_9EURO|nr:hypothetical protein Egran_03724 [Elaphomyces granulatus]
MTKTAKLKTNAKSKSRHSRAARREVSPSVDLDKSLTSLPRPERGIAKPTSFFSSHANAGVLKKRLKPRAASRTQRLRQQRGMERAEIVTDQMEKKIAKCFGKAKTVKVRKAAWEDLNDSHIKKTDHQTVGTQDGDAKTSVMHCSLPMLLAEPEKAFTVPKRQIDLKYNATAEESVQHLEDDDIT